MKIMLVESNVLKDNILNIEETSLMFIVYYKDKKIFGINIYDRYNNVDSIVDSKSLNSSALNTVLGYTEIDDNSYHIVKQQFLSKALQILKLESYDFDYQLENYKIVNNSKLKLFIDNKNYVLKNFEKPDILMTIDNKIIGLEMARFDFSDEEKIGILMGKEKMFNKYDGYYEKLHIDKDKTVLPVVDYVISYDYARKYAYSMIHNHHSKFHNYDRYSFSEYGYIIYYDNEIDDKENFKSYLSFINEDLRNLLIDNIKDINYIIFISNFNKEIHLFDCNLETLEEVSKYNKIEKIYNIVKMKFSADLSVSGKIEKGKVLSIALGKDK